MRGKGVVVEIAGKNRVIVMTSRGEFMRVPCKKPVTIGQEMTFRVSHPRPMIHLSAAAMLLVAILGTATWMNGFVPMFGSAIPEFFVTLELNPGIELALSRNKRVVSASGLNAEGQELLDEIRVVGRPFKQAVEVITARLEEKGFLQDGSREILVTISTPGTDETQLASWEAIHLDRQELGVQHELEQVVRDTFTTSYHVQVRIWQVPVHVRDEAALAGISPAHYVSVYIETVNSPGEPTVVAATVEHQGRRKVFEFEVNRPVLTPAAWTRADHSPVSEPGFPTAEFLPAGSLRGDSDFAE